MPITYDPAKDAKNIRKHGISLQRAADFNFDAAVYSIDDSQNYGEVRTIAIGFLDGRLHVTVFTGELDNFRVISLREADSHERRDYDETF